MQGLGTDEAQARLARYGENRLPESKADSLLVLFLRQFQSPLIYLLLLAAAVVYLTGDHEDAYIILFVLVFNAVVGSIQEGRAQNTLRALKRFAETSATVVRDGRELIVRDAEVVPGDVLILQEGAKVPADARVLVSHTLQADEASLTGESEPVTKREEKVAREDAPVGDRVSMVFKGTNVTSGSGRAVVVATGIGTEIGRIAQKLSGIDTDVPLKAAIRRLSRAIIITVAIGSPLLFVAGILAGNTAATMFSVVVSLAVSVVPEGLPIVMTLVLASGVWRMSRRNVLVKKLQAVEALGQARIIAVDKTGTLTKNELTVERVWAEGSLFGVEGAGYEPQGSVTLAGAAVDAANHPELLLMGKHATLCASANVVWNDEERRWRVSGDPTEAALLVLGKKTGFTKEELERELPLVTELPFDYRHKYHATLHGAGGKNVVTVVGAPEAVVALATHVRLHGTNAALTPAVRKELEDAVHALSRDGLRVVALGYRATEAKSLEHGAVGNLTLGGLYGMRDALRPEVKDAMCCAEEAGIKVVMITGDHKLTATAIARAAGIWREGDAVVSGTEIDAMDDAALAGVLGNVSVFARVTPEHKMRIITAYRSRGDVVAMTGDGVNDAPPLVAADLGVAMGGIGTEVAKEAADLVLLDDNFGSIISAIEEGRSTYKTVKKVVLYLFSTSVGEAFTIIAAILLGLPLPLLAAQIIWLNFVTDSFLVIALGLERKEDGLLAEGATRRPALVDRAMAPRIVLMGATMVIGTIGVFMYSLDGDMAKSLTLSLTTLAIFQWFNAWNCRSETRSIFAMNPFGNLYLVGALAAVVLLQVAAVTVPFLMGMLETTSLTFGEWLLCIAVASSVIVTEELRKLVYRLRARSTR